MVSDAKEIVERSYAGALSRVTDVAGRGIIESSKRQSLQKAETDALAQCGRLNSQIESNNLNLELIKLGAKQEASSNAINQALFDAINGADVVAQDGTFLGFIGSPYAVESIFNQFGDYGSKYGVNSIWNQFGTYGSEYSDLSPFNSYALKPPIITKGGANVCYLTTNRFLSGSYITPVDLLSLVRR